MKNIIIYLVFALLPIAAMPQKVIYSSEDSTNITGILHGISNSHTSGTGEKLITIADKFIGKKYVGGTLEQGKEEPLFISCTELDCTTFVELVLAIAKTENDGSTRFIDVCHNLETIRYRNGRNNGYTSRLHYISWWINDDAKEGILKEITQELSDEKQILNLSFMSSHPSSYPLLDENPEYIKEIEQLEIPYRNIQTNYIPKDKLSQSICNKIKAGDIIAITTSIKGLDVTHIGFAYYHNGVLSLLHASSSKGAVTKDVQPLREYLAGRKQHTGIRVFRAVF